MALSFKAMPFTSFMLLPKVGRVLLPEVDMGWWQACGLFVRAVEASRPSLEQHIQGLELTLPSPQ